MKIKNPYYPYRLDPREELSIDMPDADFKYNADSYKVMKWIFRIAMFAISILCIGLIIKSKNQAVQTISSTVLGGMFSLLVWLITIYHQDKVNQELAQIDVCVATIDKYLNRFNEPYYAINQQTAKMYQITDYKSCAVLVFNNIGSIYKSDSFIFNPEEPIIKMV